MSSLLGATASTLVGTHEDPVCVRTSAHATHAPCRACTQRRFRATGCARTRFICTAPFSISSAEHARFGSRSFLAQSSAHTLRRQSGQLALSSCLPQAREQSSLSSYSYTVRNHVPCCRHRQAQHRMREARVTPHSRTSQLQRCQLQVKTTQSGGFCGTSCDTDSVHTGHHDLSSAEEGSAQSPARCDARGCVQIQCCRDDMREVEFSAGIAQSAPLSASSRLSYMWAFLQLPPSPQALVFVPHGVQQPRRTV